MLKLEKQIYVYAHFMSRNTKRLPAETRELGNQFELNLKSYHFSKLGGS